VSRGTTKGGLFGADGAVRSVRASLNTVARRMAFCLVGGCGIGATMTLAPIEQASDVVVFGAGLWD